MSDEGLEDDLTLRALSRLVDRLDGSQSVPYVNADTLRRLFGRLAEKDATIAALLDIIDSCDTPLLLAAIHGFHTSAEVSERNAAIIAGARALLAPAPREGA